AKSGWRGGRCGQPVSFRLRPLGLVCLVTRTLGGERGDTVRDLLPRRRQINLPLIDAFNDVQDEATFICMQLADLEGHDVPLAIGEYAEREDGIHPECRNGFQSILFADQYRIIDAHLACVVLYRIAEVNGDTDYFQAVRGAFVPQALQQRDLT